MLTDFALCYGQMNINSTSVRMMMLTHLCQNATSDGCKCASITSNQIPPLVWEHLGPLLGGCMKMDLDFPQNLQIFLKLGHLGGWVTNYLCETKRIVV